MATGAHVMDTVQYPPPPPGTDRGVSVRYRREAAGRPAVPCCTQSRDWGRRRGPATLPGPTAETRRPTAKTGGPEVSTWSSYAGCIAG